jgi:hypothetical protein
MSVQPAGEEDQEQAIAGASPGSAATASRREIRQSKACLDARPPAVREGERRLSGLHRSVESPHRALCDAPAFPPRLSARFMIAIWEQVAASDLSNVGWQLDLLWSHSRLALFQDDPVRRVEFIVTTLQRLKMEGKLTAEQERWLPYAGHALAAAKLGTAELQWVMLNIYWQTAFFTENPVREASLVVAMLRKLHEENRLTPEQASKPSEKKVVRTKRDDLIVCSAAPEKQPRLVAHVFEELVRFVK